MPSLATDSLARNMLYFFRARENRFGDALALTLSRSPSSVGTIWGMIIMPVDLKGKWTDADIAALIGSVTDDRDWRLEVGADGVAQLSDKTANPTGADYDETLHCFLETWMQGTDFVGPSAASDKVLVGKIAKALRENYPALKAEKFVYVAL